MAETEIINSIVPIYCDGNFNGSGFIYKSYLITAAHVVDYNDNMYFIHLGCKIELNESNKIYCKSCGKDKDEYGGTIFNFYAEDLAIYSIGIKCCSLELSERNIITGEKAILFGYHYESEENIQLQYGAVELVNEYIMGGTALFPQDYCMYCKKTDTTFDIIPGYSGGPLLNENIVVGMLIESMLVKDYFHIVKSSHIASILNNYEENC